MNNFFKSIILVITFLAGTFATKAERSLVINVNDASRVSVEINYEPVEINNGANTFGEDILSDFAVVEISATEGNIIKFITDSDRKEVASWEESFTDYIYDDEKYTFNVTAVTLEEARTGEFTLTTDNPENMTVRIGTSSFSTISDLKIGENIIHPEY